jgi:uncharacterized protein YpmB
MSHILSFPKFILIGVIVVLIALPVIGEEEHVEKKLGKKDLPAEVLDSLQKNYAKAKIEDIGLITEDDKQFYEIEIKDAQGKRNLIYTGEGKLKEIEQDVHAKDISEAAMKTLRENYPSPKIHDVTRITRGDDVRWEVSFSSGGHDYDVYVSADGRFVPREDPEPGSEEDD